MKKFTLILIVASLCMLMSAAVVSADGHRWRGFHGIYEGTAAGSCLYSFLPLEPGFTVPAPGTFPPPDAFGSTIVAKGTWTFKRNGTGNFEGQQLGIAFPPFPNRNAGGVDIVFDFTYTIQHDGEITVTMEDGTFVGTYKYGGNKDLTYTVDQLEISGTVSQDLFHNSIKLISGGGEVQTYTLPPAVIGGPNVTLYGICNVVYDLFRMSK